MFPCKLLSFHSWFIVLWCGLLIAFCFVLFSKYQKSGLSLGRARSTEMCSKAGCRTEGIHCRAGSSPSPECQQGNPRQGRFLGVKLMLFLVTSNAFLATRPQLQCRHVEAPGISLPLGQNLLCRAHCGAAQEPWHCCSDLRTWSGLVGLHSTYSSVTASTQLYAHLKVCLCTSALHCCHLHWYPHQQAEKHSFHSWFTSTTAQL